MADSQPGVNASGRPYLYRSEGKCDSAHPTKDSWVLGIRIGSFTVKACSECEADILAKLANAYLIRKQFQDVEGARKKGFIGPLYRNKTLLSLEQEATEAEELPVVGDLSTPICI